MAEGESFFQTPTGRKVAIALCAIALVIAFFALRGYFGPTAAETVSRERNFICAETGKRFEYEVKVGTTYPVKSPFTGRNTGWPAELCYWKADGSVADKPTYVLLNEYKKIKGPTFCPDCGRLVRGHNPVPMPGVNPPPTEQEYRQKHPAE